MHTILLIIHVLLAISLVSLVLIQHGKGADAGAAFGSGASGTVFGARGSGNFLSRSTAVLATLFFVTSLALAYLIHGGGAPSSVVDQLKQQAPVEQQAPAPKPVPGSEGSAPLVPDAAPERSQAPEQSQPQSAPEESGASAPAAPSDVPAPANGSEDNDK